MSRLLWINAFICEKVLFEQDQVLSAIRIVEIFSVPINPEVSLEKQGVLMMVLASGRVPMEDDSEHILELVLIRPDGQTTPIGEPIRTAYPLSNPSFPRGFNIAVQVGVKPTQMGLHHIAVSFDGEEVRRIPFILQPATMPVPKP